VEGSFIELGLNLADLGAVRFTTHPVWETVASLCVLSHPDRHPLHRRLLNRVTNPRYDLGLLVDLVSMERWYPVLLCPDPARQATSPETALAAIAATDPDLARRDLQALRAMDPTNPRWPEMTPEQLLDETSTALIGYWRHVLRPLWERITDIAEADLIHRAQVITTAGLADALLDLHEHLSYTGSHIRLRLPGHHRHVQTRGHGVWFVPAVFRWPRIVVEIDTPAPVIGYSARGAGRLWEAGPVEPPQALRRVLGHSRVDILAGLDAPTTTTRLARRLHLSPGTVNTHLTAMTRAGLLQATRRGREVLYQRTALGDTLASGEPRRPTPSEAG
jgi:DNA-binding transcriptional ArsR family regulator